MVRSSGDFTNGREAHKQEREALVSDDGVSLPLTQAIPGIGEETSSALAATVTQRNG